MNILVPLLMLNLAQTLPLLLVSCPFLAWASGQELVLINLNITTITALTYFISILQAH